MTPSKYQQDIFNTVITTSQHVAVAAGPGSGKSTTLIETSKLIPYIKSSIFVAFGREIVKSLKNRLPQGTICSTMHSLGSKAIGGSYQNGWSLSEKKQLNYILPYFEGEKDNRKKWPDVYRVDRVMGMVRATMTENRKEEIEKLIIDYGLDLDNEQIPIVIGALRDFYRYNDEERSSIQIDFQDMIEMVIRNRDIPMPQYDFVFVDEVQDLSNLDREFIQRLKKPKGRIIAVGDKNQAIYGFRGAAIDSFEQFANMNNTVTLPLSISYRCAKSIVREAKEVYNDIEEWENAEEGIVTRKGKVESINEGDMVLCRNTRPLIDVFFRLIDRDVKAYVVGKDYEKGLQKVLAEFSSESTTEDSREALFGLKKKKLDALKREGEGGGENNPKYVQFSEKVDILLLLFSKFTTVYEVEQCILNLFDDKEREGVKLMTIHRSKGLENDRVFIISSYEGKTLIPSPYAVTPGQLKQESNLMFVSITRAKKELVYLNL